MYPSREGERRFLDEGLHKLLQEWSVTKIGGDASERVASDSPRATAPDTRKKQSASSSSCGAGIMHELFTRSGYPIQQENPSQAPSRKAPPGVNVDIVEAVARAATARTQNAKAKAKVAGAGSVSAVPPTDQVALKVPIHAPVKFVAYPECWGIFLALLRSAKESIRHTVYTIDSSEVLDAYEDRIAHGVRVNMLIEKSKASGPTPKGEPEFLQTLHGFERPEGPDQVQLRLFKPPVRRKKDGRADWPPALHAKSVIIDDQIAIVGSLNATQNSSTYFEMIVVVRLESEVLAQKEIFNRWFEDYGEDYEPATAQAATIF